MRRDIKFRAWDKNSKRMVYEGFDISPNGCMWINQFGVTDLYELMQFTGLLDKNSKEIYEGDIIKNGSSYANDPEQFIVVWNERDGAFNGKVGVSRLPMSCAHWFYGNCEVIGNIWEHSYLFDKKDQM